MAWYKTTPVQRTPKYNVASGTVANFETNLALPMKSVVANITPIQSGTGTPSPSNPRPISGTSVLNVTRTGKNLLNLEDGTKTVGAVTMTIASGKCTFNENVASMSDFSVLSDLTLIDGVTYTLSGTPSGGGVGKYRMWVRRSDSVYYNDDGVGVSFTYDKSYTYEITIRLWRGYGENLEFKPQIEVGSTATTYETYTGTTYTIDLGQEIIGGTAEVVGGTGEDAWVKVAWQDLTVQQYSGHIFQAVVSGMKVPTTLEERRQGILSNNIAVCPTTALNDTMADLSMLHLTDKVYIKIESASTNEEAKAILGDGYLVYELATPTPFTFTGQPINSYLGVNNVWTDSGEVLDVEYAYMPTGNSGAYFPAGSV